MRFIIIILIFTCSFNLLAQKMIVFIDYDKIIDEHPMKAIFDSIYMNLENTQVNKLRLIEQELNGIYADIVHGGCNIHILEDSLIKKSKATEEIMMSLIMQIQNFHDNAKKELRELKNKHDSIIRNDILAVIDSISLERKYFYVVDKKDLVYYLSNQDVTGIVLSRIIEK